MTELPDWIARIPSNPAIHNLPARRGGPLEFPFTQQELNELFENIFTAFIGQIAIAFGGIEIAGWKPFEFLVEWGEDLLNRADSTDNKFDGLADLFNLGGGGDFLGLLDLDNIWSDVITNIINPLGLVTAIDDILRTSFQDLLDKIFQAINGGSSTGNPIQAIKDALENIPVGNITDLIGMLDNLLPTGEFTSLLTEILESLGNIDFNDIPSNDMFDVIGDLLTSIPFLNILGIGGPGDIGGSIQETWNQLIGGFVGEIGSGAGLSDLFNIAQDVSSRATLGLFSWDILGIRNNKSLNTGFLPTSESNIGFDRVALQSSAPTFPLTQSTAITSYQRISESASKGVVSWQGFGSTNITHCFVNIYQMNTTNGLSTLVHSSANIVGNLSTSMQQNIYELPTSLQVEPSEVYGIEIAIRGTGTHTIVGSPTWLPDQAVFPRRYSAVRNSGTSAPPTTIAHSSLVYSTNVPFVEFGVSAGLVPLPHSPEILLFNTVGINSVPIPSWANFVEAITLGSGGGGNGGSGSFGFNGEGGDNGSWATGTWTRGTHFSGVASITVNVGNRGTGGGIGSSGSNGSTCLASLGVNTVSGAGGVGGNSLVIGGGSGQSPGNQVYGTPPVTYVGGSTQNSLGSPGSLPGGGGAGGGLYQSGGNGAVGAVWLRFRQS